MPVSASFIAFIKDVLSPFGEISVRRMFGGAGVYCDGLFFAIIGDDDLWLKVDDDTRAAFEAKGLAPFVFASKAGVSGQMSYYSAPQDIFDDEDELRHWVGLALSAAERAAAKKKPKRKPESAKAATKKTTR